jgi:dTDP-4-dehydrorhamnose reductase
MTLLIFGKNGQVATELKLLVPNAIFLGRELADLSDPIACVHAIHALRPHLVINAAAWTDVNRAESEEAAAAIVNGATPTALAQAAAEMRIPFVQISTDYVFDGKGDFPFASGAPALPLNAYGRSKLAGELGVRAAGGVHAILRTSWVFSAHGKNFLKTMLRLGRGGDSLSVVSDQIGGPTPARAIAAACLSIGQQLISCPEKTGTYHFSGAPDVSWADFAREIMSQMKAGTTIVDILTTAYHTPAPRPGNSRLDCATLSVFSLSRPDWRAAVRETLIELGEIE